MTIQNIHLDTATLSLCTEDGKIFPLFNEQGEPRRYYKNEIAGYIDHFEGVSCYGVYDFYVVKGLKDLHEKSYEKAYMMGLDDGKSVAEKSLSMIWSKTDFLQRLRQIFSKYAPSIPKDVFIKAGTAHTFNGRDAWGRWL